MDSNHTINSPTLDEKLFAVLAHSMAVIFPFVGALVVYFAAGDTDFVKRHAKEAANFQALELGLSILILIGVPFMLSAAFLKPDLLLVVALLVLAEIIILLVSAILATVGTIRALHGKDYHYPVKIGIL